MNIFHGIARKTLGWIDGWYYRRHRLRTLGPVLFLGHARYHGPVLRFDDGTVLQEDDPIGRLHFNNASIAALGEGSMHRVGFRFAKLMRESLRQHFRVGRTLQEQLAEAIASEKYELAAEIRDEMNRRNTRAR